MSMEPMVRKSLAASHPGEKVATDLDGEPIMPNLMPSLRDNGQMPDRGYGDCSPTGAGTKQRNAYLRYSKVFFSGTAAGGVLTFPVQAQDAFSYGPGGLNEPTGGQVPGAPAGFSGSLAESNGNKEGAIAKQRDLYKILALGVHLDPLVQLVSGEGSPPVFTETVTTAQQNSPSYEAYAHRLLLNLTTITASWDDEECLLELGVLRHYPPPTGDVGHGAMGNVTNGSPLAGAVIELNWAMWAGGRRSDDELTLTLSQRRAFAIQSPSPNLADGTYFVGIMMEAYGRHFCRA